MINLYDSKATNFNNNGLVVLSDCISCTTTEELNGMYEVVLEYPLDERGKWEYLLEENILKVDEQLFRIYHKTKNLASIKVNARHIYYDLMDNLLEDVRPTNISGEGALDWILSNTQYPHNFISMGDVGGLGTRYFVRKNPVEAIMGTDGIIATWGGELVRDNFTIKLRGARGIDRGVLISYGKNIQGIEETLDIDNLCTRLMPKGKDGLLLANKYIDSPYINNFAHPKIKVVEFSDAEDIATLAILGNAYMINNKIDIPQFNYKIDFLELTKTEEYKNYKVLEGVHLGDTVTIKHNKLNINLKAKVIKITKNNITNSIEKVELGGFKPNISSINTSIQNIKKDIVQVKSDYQIAIDNATEQITGAKGGNVVIRQDANGKPYEILIMDTNDVLTAQKVWRWSLGGMGYSSTGINGPYGVAITQDGAIVADFITAGVMNAARITAGILSAITIQNQDGSFKIDLSSTGGANYYSRGKKAMEMRGNKIDFFNWGIEGDYIGSIGSVNQVGDVNKASISIWNDLDSAVSIGYRKSVEPYVVSDYIRFDKYNVQGNNRRPIRILEGVEFSEEASHFEKIIMNNYPIHLDPSGTSYMRSMTINGTDPGVKIGNSLWVNNNIYASGVKLNGADYSEYFEWLDGNAEDEDRVGYIVALSGDKIIKASGDDVLGIISATPSIIGDTAHDGWHGKYLKDKWGRDIYETTEATYDEDGRIITPAHIGIEKKLNPYYDEKLEYIPREQRKEWDKVGLLGKLICRDDGTSSAGDYVTSIDGIASKSNIKTRMRVMKRIDTNTIKVFVM